ncbi:macro domain-containing protein [Microbacterium sp. QXD-8]|uniref:Macro domain-containing protein n=1 Tax=Microbacterium psychrotolerans TaxID=3068321 RepID=A0ABU0Z6Y4_9MICO|nr:macro domain-containing protein [Microbacterium sp. QXD-8]MDQ7880356.1 macro domain-containing protein [Microbacterium sp. QXD-8]
MTTLVAVHGDITTEATDAIVNAANNAMRGGGGVDGAIHRAGGPEILRDCIARFPNGLATGDAGWTTAGALPARWVVHTVGPNFGAGQRDRGILESCYRRSLEVADEVGARRVSFPLISAGIYAWPRRAAITTAIDAIAGARAAVDEVRLVARDESAHREIASALVMTTSVRILQGVRELHRRGFHRLRVSPGLAPSGLYHRIVLTDAADPDGAIHYTSGAETEFAGGTVDAMSAPHDVAALILRALPRLVATHDAPEYVAWFAGLLAAVEPEHALPVSFADYFDAGAGWEIGWGSGLRYPAPPR